MNSLDNIPESVYRLIFLGIVLYFALLVYATVGNEPLAAFAAYFLFGVIAIGVGTVLYLQADRDRGSPAMLGAAVCLVVGGMLQFAFLFTGVPILDDASSLVVFVGIGLYIYTVWYAD
ncbi:hypothetical protein GS429_01760 [Natronorubrum sp. JWXQ-INN-674]|uniref:Uncharacterized protein n=1 Tax=Natronorubrum halalkaliphilum TaxID=2691917 RepID=A0A6B0VIP5_9EURY|nr:hypothetical protein [Natronorubrum halalkaliphilum]MXV60816.1 hypothetical protein [Natronorubrum halalkaliphilum]